ncbi:hypothetical protein M3Y99_00290900 [Aphelenchoides fujianensis]|nr:hypothetical protein M3Y99_00290900 [Aphelenchoides fujianensis]
MSDRAGDPLVYRPLSRNSRPERASKGDDSEELLLHERLQPYTEFCLKAEPVIRLSPDGSHAYLFFDEDLRFHVVDLIPPLDVPDFAVVGPTAILALETYALWLLRLDVESGTFEAIELERRPDYSATYVFTEICGTHVELKRTVLQQYYSSEYRFVRLHVDEARLEVDAVEPLTVDLDLHLTADGRWLYGLTIYHSRLNTLHVFDIERQKWSTKKLTGEIGRVHAWTTPDSLVRLAVDALRRHNLDVVGKEEFHAVMNGPCKSVFPSFYAGMTPIPRL